VKLFELELKFHGEIARLSGNQEIKRILDEQHLVERSYQLGADIPWGRKMVTERGIWHRDIARAMRRRDADKVERLLRQHVLIGKEAQLTELKGGSMDFQARDARHRGGRSTARKARRQRR